MTPERKAEYHRTLDMLRRCAEGQTNTAINEDVAVTITARRPTCLHAIAIIPVAIRWLPMNGTFTEPKTWAMNCITRWPADRCACGNVIQWE